MLLHELAEATGVSAASIKYYRRAGLLPPGERITTTRQDYGRAHVERLELIQVLREVAGAVHGPDEVRLVGAELEEIKALRRGAGYLVEWDIPAEITMDQYLARKKANAPKYAEVPETSFLRTYVREDTAKCLCFYDAPDEDAVVRAREAVSTPIDRIWALGAIELDTTGA